MAVSHVVQYALEFFSFISFALASVEFAPSKLFLKSLFHVILVIECDRRMFATVT
ncbi:hypothetical protein FOXG_21392 [Fusarium oxysporum f. sp. lycopersici 4287]|uniref:Uncharacterized protein n=1 Tax=Fusarium oxysporum f. sp. lycopersici (strain 4287 / CBS 123668 / FGSC 9935 / NRRL 34936) TaxID=426428 RepID=A0A0J9VXS0_FUSO4|nr:hypothetical protein FOXG_20907 [Fusarium oxysporum f. sp. lycopersici 4287]XP_018253638.1 hypothetical protein FOXG_21392 [Fusarium oxysporum f. sp. lycopersici 4287]EWZ78366.1 hypothetical protein FOWG_17380 [Fusarium oxysporum f. sp. lycopersici MN25]KNB13750.1 hypothetical protein FOXG_20907 [Fusarium oxysporum f. sp. lycopersici 4287]KNB15593.1 hypothetical protein FOXG_21392 [Fusarium oxysporum f. sp. lycopersici 4287]